jgi:hypothetical protein
LPAEADLRHKKWKGENVGFISIQAKFFTSISQGKEKQPRLPAGSKKFSREKFAVSKQILSNYKIMRWIGYDTKH